VEVYHRTVREQSIRRDVAQNGTLCTEWVSHLPLRTLRLLSPDGLVINPCTSYRALCTTGRQIKDVVHWTWSRPGELKVTVLTASVNTSVRRQVGHLVKMLVLNFPQLMERGAHASAVRYGTKERMEHPFPLWLDDELKLRTQDARGHSSHSAGVALTHRDLEKTAQELIDTRGSLTHIHPHPRLARMVYLWAGARRWAFTRRQIKRCLVTAAMAKGRAGIHKAELKWQRHSAPTAAGLAKLHWRMIRLVVG
jgi:hypothetical protein